MLGSADSEHIDISDQSAA